jgi:hypothetical protein
MQPGQEIVLTSSQRREMASRIPDQRDIELSDRYVNFSKTAGGWSLTTCTKAAPPNQVVIDKYEINSDGGIQGTGEPRSYHCSGSMCTETGTQRWAYSKTEHFSKTSLADRILSELAN